MPNIRRSTCGVRTYAARASAARILHGIILQESELDGTDFASADLQGADLSGANLRGTLLEGADLRKAVLRFVDAAGSILEDAKMQGVDLWGAQMVGADLSRADLQGSILEEANFEGADLAEADLRGANLKRANLKGANLRGADLRGAVFGRTNLDGAVMRDARMEDLVLTNCTLTHVHTCGTRLEKTRLEQDQLGGAIGEDVSGEYGLARKGYLALERNFDELGDHTAARWAYQRRRRMEKWHAVQQTREAWAQRRWGLASSLALKVTSDQIVEFVCDYGESVWRVVGTLLMIFIVFVPVYGLTSTVLRVDDTADGKSKAPTCRFADLALFSLAAMTSPGNPPDYLVPRNEIGYMLAGLQTVLSIFLTGLMGFVAGNRIRR